MNMQHFPLHCPILFCPPHLLLHQHAHFQDLMVRRTHYPSAKHFPVTTLPTVTQSKFEWRSTRRTRWKVWAPQCFGCPFQVYPSRLVIIGACRWHLQMHAFKKSLLHHDYNNVIICTHCIHLDKLTFRVVHCWPSKIHDIYTNCWSL